MSRTETQPGNSTPAPGIRFAPAVLAAALQRRLGRDTDKVAAAVNVAFATVQNA